MADKEEVKKRFEESIEEGQGFYHTQSTKVSQNIRTLVMGIIAIIWVVSYNDGLFELPNIWLIISLFSCFLYLSIDIIHYYIDTCFYYKKLLSLDEYYGKEEYLEIYNQALIKYSKVSFLWIKIKFYLFAIIAIIFIIGMCKHLL